MNNFRDWGQVADAIYLKISENEQSEYTYTLDKIKSMCQKTGEDLRYILSELEEFQTELFPVDQNKCKNCFSAIFLS